MKPLLLKQDAYIAGRWEKSSLGFLSIHNPSSGELVGMAPLCSEPQIRAAFEGAQAAFPSWAALPATERSEKLKSLHRLILDAENELSEILSLEQGKPLSEARAEIRYGAAFVEWYAEEARRVYGETIPAASANKRILVLKQPVGVCAAITPWNFPNAMITRKMAPALAAGCTMVLKPAPETPLSALAIAALVEQAGFPAGVFSVVTADAELFAKVAMQLDFVRKVTFTGSTEVGKILMRQSADSMKRLTCELGGNAPFIVFEDADLGQAVEGAMFAKFRNAGQTCISVNRFLVHDSLAEEFARQLSEKVARLRVGDGMNPTTDIGPLINREALQKVRALLEDAVERGARLVYGSIPDSTSLFITPVIVSGIDERMRIWNEEIFGPVCALRTFRDEEEALTLANASLHGLASYAYTKDLSRAFRVAESLRFGMVGLNDTRISCPQAPFGGMKESGFGREGGWYGLQDYLDIKYLSVGV